MPDFIAKRNSILRCVDKPNTGGPIRNNVDTALNVTSIDDAGMFYNPQNLLTLQDGSVTGSTPASAYVIATDPKTGKTRVFQGYSNAEKFFYNLVQDSPSGVARLQLFKDNVTEFGELKAPINANAKTIPLKGKAEGKIKVDGVDVSVSVDIIAFAQNARDGVTWLDYILDTTIQQRLQTQANSISLQIDNTSVTLRFGVLGTDSDASTTGEDNNHYALTPARSSNGVLNGSAYALFTLNSQ